MNGRTRLMLIAVVLVVGGLLAFLASRERDKPPSSAEPPSASGIPQRRPAGPRLKAIPQAGIKVDGRADDWSEVPACVRPAPDIRGKKNYSCEAVKLARDAENLYVLFILGRGIREKFDAEMKQGRPSTHSLGYLSFETEGKKFSICIPTGFAQTFDEEGNLVNTAVTASFDVGRYSVTTQSYEDVFAAEFEEHSDYIAFEGKFLEFRIPLKRLGIKAGSSVKIELDEM